MAPKKTGAVRGERKTSGARKGLVRITYALPAALIKRVKMQAITLDTNQSTIIQDAVEQYFKGSE
jgi:hypothetical protein